MWAHCPGFSFSLCVPTGEADEEERCSSLSLKGFVMKPWTKWLQSLPTCWPSEIIHHPCFSCFWAVAALSGTKLPHRGY